LTTLDVVICTYNRAASLDRCLQALGQQRGTDVGWRVTVVDNNCTDDTAGVVADHVRRGGIPELVRVIEPRQGLTPARQRGVGESTADWVAFVDDDCEVGSEWVAEAGRFATTRPDAGAFGGRVRPVWGRMPPDHLPRHAWLFAAQDLGEEVREVESLVGAGMVINRRALEEVGWTAEPYLADRTGVGYTSGGDVEICLRLAGEGWKLWYAPALQIDHRIDSFRQSLRAVLGTARGLGAGAELVSLMSSPDPGKWVREVHGRLRVEIRRHLASTYYVPNGRYPWRDWLIRAAYLSGQWKQHRSLSRDEATRGRLGGVAGRLTPPGSPG
jgi:glucosyl-dolichyl phosphate glucuronosyltransferase